jgi:predicted nucleic acid-binding protein
LRIYFDTSFLSSLYVRDANTLAATDAMKAASSARLVTHLTELELRNALELRVFRKETSAATVRAAYADWQLDLAEGLFELSPLPENWIQRSHTIAQQSTARLGVRTLDLIHVASAVELKADTLFSFDEKQRRLARELKLKLN